MNIKLYSITLRMFGEKRPLGSGLCPLPGGRDTSMWVETKPRTIITFSAARRVIISPIYKLSQQRTLTEDVGLSMRNLKGILKGNL